MFYISSIAAAADLSPSQQQHGTELGNEKEREGQAVKQGMDKKNKLPTGDYV